MDDRLKEQINSQNGDESGERFGVVHADITLLTECENLTEIVGNSLIRSVAYDWLSVVLESVVRSDVTSGTCFTVYNFITDCTEQFSCKQITSAEPKSEIQCFASTLCTPPGRVS